MPLFRSCSNIWSLTQLHAHLIVTGLHKNPLASTKLIESYAQMGSLQSSRLVFESFAGLVRSASEREGKGSLGEIGTATIVSRAVAKRVARPGGGDWGGWGLRWSCLVRIRLFCDIHMTIRDASIYNGPGH